MKSVFFMPVFNQIEDFPQVLDELKSIDLPCDEILLVNNGSTDGSEELCRKSGYPLIDLPKNRGLGYSQILSVEWALERDYEVFGTIASNGKMLPSEMHRVIAPVESGEADFVTGSRFMPGGDSPHLPLFRRITIGWMNGLVRAIVGAKLTDATCGYRAMRLDLFKRAQFDWRAEWLYTYEWEYYVYAKVILNNLRWQEVPITMRYPTRGVRYSKIRPFIDWWRMIKPWWRARLNRDGFGPSDHEAAGEQSS